jgi:stage II sporulation protein M
VQRVSAAEAAALISPWAAFAAFIALGLLHPSYGLVEAFAEEVASRFAGRDPFSLTLLIFISNLSTTILVYFLTLAFILPGLALIAFNGYIIGSVASYAVNEQGLTVLQVLAALLPHGVVEIPAFLGAASGGAYCLLRCRSKSYAVKFTLSVLSVAALLLMVAAVIEVFITPAVMRAVGAPAP